MNIYKVIANHHLRVGNKKTKTYEISQKIIAKKATMREITFWYPFAIKAIRKSK